MSVIRTIHPKQLTFGSNTWTKDQGGTVMIDIAVDATPVMDETGEDQTFSFLGFYHYTNSVTVRLHDVNVFHDVAIGDKGNVEAVLSIPDNSSPIQGAAEAVLNMGMGYCLNTRITQGFGNVAEQTINLICQPSGIPTDLT